MFRLATAVCVLTAFPIFVTAQESETAEPKDSNGYYERGEALAEKGKLDAAIQDFNRAIRLDPRNAIAYRQRGGTFVLKGDPTAAIKDFTEAIRLDPKEASAYSRRGGALILKGDYAAAIKDFTEAIRLDATDARAYGNRGSLLFFKGDHTAAINDLTECIRLNPFNKWAYNNRGQVFYKNKDFAAAIQDFTKALSLDARDPVSAGSLAWILATCPDGNIRDGKKAVIVATNACELTNWRVVDPIHVLAAACAESGDWESAVKRQEQAIELAQDERDKLKGREHLELYKQKKPYREQPAGDKAAARGTTPPETRR